MTDDEKFIFKGNYTDEEGDNLEWYQHLTMENAKELFNNQGKKIPRQKEECLELFH